MALGRTPSLSSVAFPAFGLIGAVLVVSMFLNPWREAAIARRTFYGLTDRRALVVVAGNKKKVRSLLPHEFSLQRRDLSDGSGALVLKQETAGTGDGEKITEIGFFGIPHAREVERLARELITRPR